LTTNSWRKEMYRWWKIIV